MVFGAIGVLAGLGWWLLVVGAALGALVGWMVVRRSPDRVIAAIGATPLVDAPRIENLVEGLCVANGIPKPELLVIEVPTHNVCAVGLHRGTSSLIVTRGLLDDLARIELEGVAARELALIKSGHTALATVVAALAGVWASAPNQLLPSRADLVADMSAVGLTRYPPGLLDALGKIRANAEVASVPGWTRHLWIEDPVSPADGRAGSYHSPIEERIATLREL